jgi:hypothetical protein
MMRATEKVTLLLAATGALHACGGGSSADSPPPVPADEVAPVILVDAPLNGSLTSQSAQSFRGQLSEPASLTVNGVAARVDAANRFSFGPVILEEGTNSFALVAIDSAGNRATVEIQVTLDSLPPPPAHLDAITRSSAIAGSVNVVGLAGSVESTATVELTNEATAEQTHAVADESGAFSAHIAAEDGDRLIVQVRDAAGNASKSVILEPPLPREWRFGVIGDSIAAATHSNDMCGSGDELMNCLRKRLGAHDSAWSYAAGEQVWSLGRQAGYNATAILSAADDGAEWKDALVQAQSLFQNETGLERINQVFIGLGSNDVCAEFGHPYAGDLERIAQHMDNTLTYLSDAMAGRPGATVYLSGTPNIVGFRNLMFARQHDLAFSSCQALWDLDVGALRSEARDSLCKGELGAACDVLPADLQEELLNLLLDSVLDQNNVDEGPCGRVLSSGNGEQQRREAREFNITLNELMAQKAAEYDRRNDVRVIFSNALYEAPVEPYMVSQIDCYHPSRAGQLDIAQTVWQGFHPDHARTDRYFYDGFDSNDKCGQAFTQWGGCWMDGGAPAGFDSWIGDDGWYRLLKDTDNNVSHWVERSVGDLSAASALWLSFRHRRTGLDDRDDRVNFLVYDADGDDNRPPGWVEIDAFRGPGIDVGIHSGEYYDLSPYLSADLRIRFQTSDARGMENGDGLKWDNVNLFAW